MPYILILIGFNDYSNSVFSITFVTLFSCSKKQDQNTGSDDELMDIVTQSVSKLQGISSIDSLTNAVQLSQ